MDNKETQFKHLMMSYLSETISESDQLLLIEIINSDKKYIDEYNEMVKLKAISLIPQTESTKSTNYINLKNNILKNNQSEKRQIPFYFKVAAILIILLSTSFTSYFVYKSILLQNNSLTCETVVPFGSQSRITLPDSTVVWLNSGSILKYDNSFAYNHRTVRLTGEGYFEVKKDVDNPFLVVTKKMKIKVLGTVFNVRSYTNEDETEVNLIKGRVNVLIENKTKCQSIKLLPNEKLVYNSNTNSISLSETDASRSALWTTGKLCFVDATIEDIAKDLERRYDVSIQIKTQIIKDELFSGSLDLTQPIEQVLQYMDVDRKYTITQSAKTICITNKIN